VAADAEGRAEKIRRVIELLKAEDDPNVRALAEQHADRLAGRLGVNNARTFRALSTSIKKSLSERVLGPEHSAEARRTAPPDPEHAIERSILGALLDFPELLTADDFIAHHPHLQGALAAAIACIQTSASPAPGPEQAQGSAGTYLHRALPRFPETLRDFAAQRLAAPVHDEIDTARVELFANLDKLRRMELSRMSTSTLSEMERARQEGDFEQELALLRQHESRARGKRRL
jgi:hypothetical protein